MRLSRHILLLLAGLAALVVVTSPGRAYADDVRASTVNSASDAPLFIADKKGYFKDEGLNVHFTNFDSATKMIAPLGAGQLDVGGGAASAGLYNAVARGVDVKIVADKARNAPGYSYTGLLVRKDLIESGKVKEFKDLKGLKFALSAAGNSDSSVLDQALKHGGLKFSDAETVYMAFPQHTPAFANGAIDGSITTEPTLSFIKKAGFALELAPTASFYPNQNAMLLFGTQFMKQRPETAKRFMRAYIRGIRFYNDALKDGALAGPNAAEVIAILTEYSNVKDPAILRSITPNACDPDGRVNVDSLRIDLQFFKDQGLIEGKIEVQDVIDTSLVEAAVKELGPYRKNGSR